MNPEKWKKIEDIFQDALDLPAAEREQFVAEKCAGDAELRGEVEKLIARYETEDEFLESPVWTDSDILQATLKNKIADSLDREILPPRHKESFIGRQIKVYQLVEELGRGGMGVVYRAERNDGEFRQQVAIKLIKRGMDSDFIVKKFRHERQILANFNHPYIARLLDGGTTDEDGLPYFVMEYIEGKPFFKYIEAAKLDLRARLNLFLSVCNAVAYAHDKKIIHRDIKPGNIIVGADGTPRLLDFGIAKILDPDSIHESVAQTATQMRLMTPEYASPEQARGDEITPASDQYSLGVLLFEMITGTRPYKFSSRSPHEIARVICEEEPSAPSSTGYLETTTDETDFTPDGDLVLRSNDDFGGKLDRIILKALRKNPSERYDSIKDLAGDIGRLLANLPVRAEDFETGEKSAPKIETPAEIKPDQKSIAVLPLQILNHASGDETSSGQFLSVGLADALITRLSNVRQFIVRPTSAVLRYSEGITDTFKAGRDLNVEFVLSGNILRAGTRIRISVQLLNVANQSIFWAERFDEDFTDVLTLEDKVSAKVADLLVPQLTTGERKKLAKRGTKVPEAYEAYLRGRFYRNIFSEDAFAKAFVAYHEAISHDAKYALAYAGIADYYIWLGVYGGMPPKECYPLAKKAALRAIELDGELAEAYASLAFAQICGDYDWIEAEKNAVRAVELNPNYSTARLWYSYILLTAKRFDESIAQAKRAVELDPLSYVTHHVLALNYYFARRFDEAVAQAAANVGNFPHISATFFTQAWTLRYLGKHEEALNSSKRAMELSGESLYDLLGYAQTLAAAGRRAATAETLKRIFAQGEKQYLSYYQIAIIHIYSGETEKALDALERAFEDREGWLIWLRTEPALDELRGDPRFINLRKKIDLLGINLSEQTYLPPLTDARKFAAVEPSKSTENRLNENADGENLKIDSTDGDAPRDSKIAARRAQTSSEAETIVQTENAAQSNRAKIVGKQRRRLPKPLKYLLTTVALVILAFGVRNFFTHLTIDFSSDNARSGENLRDSFAAKMSPKRLTDAGREQSTAISPDGKLIASVFRDDDRNGIIVRDADGGNARQIVAPDTALIAGLSIAPDNQTIYYSGWSQNFIARNLYRVSAADGTNAPQLVLEQVNSKVGFSADGRQFAYNSSDQKTRQSFLKIAALDANGAVTATRTLAVYAQPNFVRSNASLAPDGKRIAYVVSESINRQDSMSLYVYDLEANTETKIGGQTFGDVSGVDWHSAGEVVVSAAERDGAPYQLWSIAYPNGEAARLTNDFNSYFDVSIAKNSSILTTARREKSAAVWLVDLNSTTDAGRQLTAGGNRLDGLSGVNWTSDNQILYVGGIGSQYSLMSVGADGANNRVLDVNVVKPSFPSLTKDRRYVIYADAKEHSSGIWRYDTATGAVTQLVSNYAIAPSFSADNRFVIYSTNGSARKLSLHKIPLEGGDETEITNALSARAAASPDGRWLACYYSGEETGNSWRIAILSAETGAVRRVIAPPDTFNQLTPVERPLAWSPDNRSLYYVNDKNNVSNIFRIAVETETPPAQITHFTSGRIFDFSLSPDGRRAALARGSSTSDVLIYKSF